MYWRSLNEVRLEQGTRMKNGEARGWAAGTGVGDGAGPLGVGRLGQTGKAAGSGRPGPGTRPGDLGGVIQGPGTRSPSQLGARQGLRP